MTSEAMTKRVLPYLKRISRAERKAQVALAKGADKYLVKETLRAEVSDAFDGMVDEIVRPMVKAIAKDIVNRLPKS